MSTHSSIVGGSTADRLIKCPASFQATVSLPAIVTAPSEYAEEGTAMHKICEQVMLRRKKHPNTHMIRYAASLIGHHFHDRVFTEDHYGDMIMPALVELEALEAEHGGDFKVHAVEKHARFPGVIGAFGTIDLVLVNKRYVLHVDWKFGAGVPILAAYDHPDSTTKKPLPAVINSQLLFYVTSCRAAMPKLYNRRKMAGAIIQPRADVMSSWTDIVRDDISRFRKLIEEAVDAALLPQPERTKGEHCRFAACKATCPLWTAPLLDIPALRVVSPTPPEPLPTPYGAYLADAKALADALAMWSKEINDQLHAYLEDGGRVPGWRLKLKATKRAWVDEGYVATKLRELGFSDTEIWQRKLVTFASADATAKLHRVKIPDELRVAPQTTETTVAADGDPAPVVERAVLGDRLRASLKKLVQG